MCAGAVGDSLHVWLIYIPAINLLASYLGMLCHSVADGPDCCTYAGSQVEQLVWLETPFCPNGYCRLRSHRLGSYAVQNSACRSGNSVGGHSCLSDQVVGSAPLVESCLVTV